VGHVSSWANSGEPFLNEEKEKGEPEKRWNIFLAHPSILAHESGQRCVVLLAACLRRVIRSIAGRLYPRDEAGGNPAYNESDVVDFFK
jgi:hypothetical protein